MFGISTKRPKVTMRIKKYTMDDPYLHGIHEVAQNGDWRICETSRVEACDHRVVRHHSRLLNIT